MQKSDGLTKVALLVALIACSNVFAHDLGVIGNSFPVAEEDIVEWIRRKAFAMQQSGELDRKHQTLRDQARAYAARPRGALLPRSAGHVARPFDPSFTLQEDITDADGRVLAKAGTKVNPLRYRAFNRTLCFIDGDDAAQVVWLKAHCNDPLQSIPVLVNGDIQALQKQVEPRLYFDQRQELVSRFQVRALPTVVRQSGTILYVEEFAP